MTDFLAAFHFVRYLELRRREQEPCGDRPPQPPFAVGLGIFRRLRARKLNGEN